MHKIKFKFIINLLLFYNSLNIFLFINYFKLNCFNYKKIFIYKFLILILRYKKFII